MPPMLNAFLEGKENVLFLSSWITGKKSPIKMFLNPLKATIPKALPLYIWVSLKSPSVTKRS